MSAETEEVSWWAYAKLVSKPKDVQLHPAITDLKEPSLFIYYRRISAIAIIRNKEKFSQGDWKTASVKGGFPLILDPL